MCKQCNTRPVYVFTNKRQVCKTCFIRWFQDKVLYTMRKFLMAKKDEVIGYKKGNSFRDVVLEDVLKYYETRAPVDVVKMPSKRVNKIAVSSATDQEAEKIIYSLINGDLKLLKVSPVEGKIIKPLYLFLDKEVMLYAKLRKLKFNSKKDKKTKFSIIINELEKKHPEVKRAIVNSYLKFM